MGGNQRGSFGGRYEPPPVYDYLGEPESEKMPKADWVVFITACIVLGVVLALVITGRF